MALCAVMAVSGAGGSSVAVAQSQVSPDSGYFRPDSAERAGAFTQHWLASELRGALEPPLVNIPDAADTRVYRMTALGGWGGATVIRVERAGSQWIVVRKLTRPDSGGWQNPKRIVEQVDSTRVGSGQVSRLIRLIEDSHYWKIPASTCLHGMDGWELLLEARTSDGYHSLLCWVPEPQTAPSAVATLNEFDRLASANLPKLDRRAP